MAPLQLMRFINLDLVLRLDLFGVTVIFLLVGDEESRMAAVAESSLDNEVGADPRLFRRSNQFLIRFGGSECVGLYGHEPSVVLPVPCRPEETLVRGSRQLDGHAAGGRRHVIPAPTNPSPTYATERRDAYPTLVARPGSEFHPGSGKNGNAVVDIRDRFFIGI